MGGEGIDPAEAAADRFDLSPTRTALAALATALDRFYDNFLPRAVATGALGRANGLLIARSPLLVPIDFARRGPFAQDPTKDVPPLPDLAPALTLPDLEPGSHQDRITRHSLVRGQNRVVWTLRQTAQAVASTQI